MNLFSETSNNIATCHKLLNTRFSGLHFCCGQ